VIATLSGKWFPYDRNDRNDRHWVATIAEIETKSISAIVVARIAAIAEEWFPCDHNDRSLNLFFSDGSDRSDHNETSLKIRFSFLCLPLNEKTYLQNIVFTTDILV